MTEGTTLSAADVAAVTRNNDGGMFGNGNDWAWIVILLLFGWGGRGFGGYGGGYGGGSGVGENYVLATDFATIERKLDGINNGICDATFQLTNNLNGNFRTLDGAICNLGYQALQNTNAIQSQLAECCCDVKGAIKDVGTQTVFNTAAIQKDISACCCDLEKMNMQDRFDAQAYNCNTLQAIDKLGDRIIDYMSAEKTQALRDENMALRLAASQERQNRYLVNELRPCPIPAYITCNPYAYTNPCNSGCGCGSY